MNRAEKLQGLAVFFILWILLSGLAWMYLWRGTPESPAGWLMLIVFGAPAVLLVQIVGEAIGELVRLAFSNAPGVKHSLDCAERRSPVYRGENV